MLRSLQGMRDAVLEASAEAQRKVPLRVVMASLPGSPGSQMASLCREGSLPHCLSLLNKAAAFTGGGPHPTARLSRKSVFHG